MCMNTWEREGIIYIFIKRISRNFHKYSYIFKKEPVNSEMKRELAYEIKFDLEMTKAISNGKLQKV